MFKKYFSTKKFFITTMISLAFMSFTVFGADDAVAVSTDTALVNSMTSAMSKIVSNTMAGITAIAPIGITLFGAVLAWKYAMKFLKTISGN